jgi:hypothetical protein
MVSSGALVKLVITLHLDDDERWETAVAGWCVPTVGARGTRAMHTGHYASPTRRTAVVGSPPPHFLALATFFLWDLIFSTQLSHFIFSAIYHFENKKNTFFTCKHIKSKNNHFFIVFILLA